MSNLKTLTKKLKQFIKERDWEQFHNHKDLALSLVLEAVEVLEHFQWKANLKEIKEQGKNKKNELADELADVAFYLLILADNLGIDIIEAIENKMKKNSIKYPIEKCKGKAKKYNEL